MKLMEICFGDCVPTPWDGTNDAGRSSKKGEGFDFATVAVIYKRIVGPAPGLA
jgi:hypothetical protein